MKWGVLVFALLLPLALILAEATICHAGCSCGQCATMVCCISVIPSDHSITHTLLVLPYTPSLMETAATLFPDDFFHPPRV